MVSYGEIHYKKAQKKKKETEKKEQQKLHRCNASSREELQKLLGQMLDLPKKIGYDNMRLIKRWWFYDWYQQL